MGGQVPQLGVLCWVGADCPEETGGDDQKGVALHVKDLSGCLELLYGMGSRVGEPLWVRVRAEPVRVTLWSEVNACSQAEEADSLVEATGLR